MSLVVIGEGNQTVGVAAVASAISGENVILDTGTTVPDIKKVSGPIAQGPASLSVVGAGEAEGGTAFLYSGPVADMAERMAPYAEAAREHPVLVAPGNFAGAWRLRRIFQLAGHDNDRILESNGSLFGGISLGAETTAAISKKRLAVAGFDEAKTAELTAAFSRYFPNLAASDLATTSLSNTNHVLHPPTILANAVQVDRGESIRLFREAQAPASVRLMEAVDRERLLLIRALGGEEVTAAGWLDRFYGDQGLQGSTLFENLTTFPSFETSMAPTAIRSSFVMDDVKYGLSAYLTLARLVNIAVPVIASVKEILETVLGERLDTPVQTVVDYLSHEIS